MFTSVNSEQKGCGFKGSVHPNQKKTNSVFTSVHADSFYFIFPGFDIYASTSILQRNDFCYDLCRFEEDEDVP